MQKLKTFGTTRIIRDMPGHGQARCVVACTSERAAATLLGVTLHWFRTYGCETGNADEVATCAAEPGVVFVRPLDHCGDGGWRRLVSFREGAKPPAAGGAS